MAIDAGRIEDRPGGGAAAEIGAHRAPVPSMEPVEPLRRAPARFGAAGISAGEDRFYKSTVRLSRTSGPWQDGAVTRRRGGAVGAADGLARGLGWFSIALGLAELLAAKDLARWLGMEDKSGVVRLYGARELGNGVALLASGGPGARAPWMWTRVGGDALDLATLAPGLDRENPHRERVVGAMIAVAGVMALDVLCGAMLSGSRR